LNIKEKKKEAKTRLLLKKLNLLLFYLFLTNASVTKIRSRRAISCLRNNFRRNGEGSVVIRSREVGSIEENGGVVDHDEAVVSVDDVEEDKAGAAVGKEGRLLRDAFGDARVDGGLDDTVQFQNE